ncbi:MULTISPECIES: DUF4407 domain-containing protein [Leeuwenhoekiella]|jgi:hypothetical protein|uniref:DUF4407 domain-containing protein n=1 Tax=Leeuwenhoekiella blandensis (strain CECT 7118 / CCUG 51940 / KCTC 22103 / MED217) TaxID=398720 RepID=A3XKJ2_LEEBM|nr:MULTISPECIES: DUF4407 domain-containing protein [Leeuwenhoekiella]EAQ49932.1 hypothetical protein MED217_02240 [Leeuwenhoekiella blandensis MED217]MAO42598.1 DUF4407 domain-containing protein [Leeuwenhoekiella sp.]HBT08702.1 DUF4407 domain-containing protein [Leeuwenhoekiella sp.]|tara:strand:+ start:8201 stop:9301 length:1101 start_codon:yes stop_codon:yes gene_type:complete
MLKKFFILCSGADHVLLDSCAPGEQNKYAGIGATVFFTALMAFIASGYALYTVFDSIPMAIGFGFVWGLLIFNLDRFIVSTIKKRDNFLDEFLQALPRLILAVIIAVVISKPLELKIFEKEIDRVLLEQKNDLTLANQNQIADQFTPAVAALDTEIENLKSEVVTKETEVNALYDIYITEAEGTSGTGKLGKGPVYKEKREKHDAALAELQQLKQTNSEKIAALELEKASLASDYETRVSETQPIIDNFDGLMARIDALETLPWLPSFFIFLLFLAIETTPIFAKLISPKGEYDLKLADAEGELKSWTTQKANQRKNLIDADNVINDKVYGDLTEEDELYNYKKKMARDLMQKQQDAFYKRQSKLL